MRNRFVLYMIVASSLLPTGAANASSFGPSSATGLDGLCLLQTVDASAIPITIAPLSTCSLVGKVVTSGLAGVKVPPPNFQNSASVSLAGGGEDELIVYTDPDGVVHVDARPAGATGTAQTPGDSSAYPDPCSDRAFTTMNFKESDRHLWRYNATGEPSNLAATSLDDQAIIESYNNITTGRTECNRGGRKPSGLSNQYGGLSSTPVGATPSGTCTATDNNNTVGWVRLNINATAITCSSAFRPGIIVGELMESDTALNSNFPWVTNIANCTSGYDITSTMTHEVGHTYGMGHVDEATHGNLTMSTTSNGQCQISERTLGEGDLSGLESLYGSTTVM